MAGILRIQEYTFHGNVKLLIISRVGLKDLEPARASAIPRP